MSIFDGYLMVDWSASSTPKTGRDSIWIAWGRSDGGPPQTANLSTRTKAREFAESLLADAVSQKLRVLVGFDFAYSYPRGFATWLGLDEGRDAWQQVWREIASVIRDDENGIANANNRFRAAAHLNEKIGVPSFIGPFWSCPDDKKCASLLPTKPDFKALPESQRFGEYRRTEIQLQKDGNPTIQSAWKLFTSGSVGSQALLGIPVVHSLVEKFAEHSQVWPFQTGFASPAASAPGPYILHVEIWPGILGPIPDPTCFACRDEAQVFALVEAFRQLDQQDQIASLFVPNIPNPNERVLAQEEGWIFGAGVESTLAGTIRSIGAKVIPRYCLPEPNW
ncbi:MAG: hypothetical protein ABJC13_10870 [Acidobacteriota bacterium]